MKKLFVIATLALLFSAGNLFAQAQKAVYLEEADEMPELVGGIDALASKIIYPESAKEAGVQGKVYVTVFLNEKGDVDKTAIKQGVSKELDEAAAAAIKKCKFTPGKKDGKNVKVQIVIPVMFKLS